MKHLNRILCGLLFSFVLAAGSVPALADENVISTKAAADGRTVTVEVGTQAGTELTSGRVVVSYDADVLTLKAVGTTDTWEAEDVNTETAGSVSYAFADDEGKEEGGNVMTLTFVASDAANGKETMVTTEVKELYNEDTLYAQTGSSETVKVTPEWKTETESPAGTVTAEDTKSFTEAVIEQIENATAGATISVTVSASEETISASIFEELRGKDVTVEFHLENGVIWRVNGKHITTPKDIDLGVVINSENIPQTVLDMIMDKGIQYEVQFSLDFDGELGGTFYLSIPLGTKGTGFFGNLYYYNPNTGKPEYMQTSTVDESGMATYSFTHASDYVVAVSTTDGATVNTVQTGDNASFTGIILLFCGAGVILAYAIRRARVVR